MPNSNADATLAQQTTANGEVYTQRDIKMGMVAGLAAYVMWGLFPVLFHQLDGVSAFVVVANRIVWSTVLLVGILWPMGRLGEVKAAFLNPNTFRALFVSAALLSVNWLIFVWAVIENRILEASFGYFITPLASVALGVLLLGERLNKIQTLSVIIAIVAAGVLAIGVGGVPIVSITLAVSFGLYGYIRKTVVVGSAPALLVETLMLFPFALAYLGFEIATNGMGPHADPRLMFFLILTGPATSITLILFAYGARRLKLTVIGMLQYIAPTGHIFLALYVFGETLGTPQILSFVLIWVSLAIYSYDSITGEARRERRLQRETDGRLRPR